ncbi:MAG: FabA-like domain protein [Puniceicoccaceae bacterium]|nr:MAG: FabA-like domain protein [Puniceicoccaceae bacterium]
MSINPHEPAPPGEGPKPPLDEASLRESLKRCSPETFEAALAYQKSKDAGLLPGIILGIVERFLDPEVKPRLRAGDDNLRFVEDLGLDSLTMMEAIILVEEVVGMPINNDELRNLRTIGDLKIFIDCKARGLPPPPPPKHLPLELVADLLPQQPPFLFLKEAVLTPRGATGKYPISGDEAFLQGHFKDNPVFPASLLLEALGQLAVLYLLGGTDNHLTAPVDPGSIYFTGCEGVRCHRICRPGEVLSLSVKPKRLRLPLATFEGTVMVGGEKAALAEEITLTFAYRAEAEGSPAPAAAPKAAGGPAVPASTSAKPE